MSTSSVPSPSSSLTTTGSVFDPLLLSPADLPQGLARVAYGPVPAAEFTDSMTQLGVQGAYLALYADEIPPTDKANVMEQVILKFSGANASAMLKEQNNSFTMRKSNAYTPLFLPDPEIGENSFAVKVTITEPTGAELNYYTIGFVKSGIFELFSMKGTPDTYQGFLKTAERAAEKISK
ncbi:MAG: hypothetical protein Q7T80_03365 [Methanoregula sp.]|nr:hypothetical protein [Methanoregula sp.]